MAVHAHARAADHHAVLPESLRSYETARAGLPTLPRPSYRSGPRPRRRPRGSARDPKAAHLLREAGRHLSNGRFTREEDSRMAESWASLFRARRARILPAIVTLVACVGAAGADDGSAKIRAID